MTEEDKRNKNRVLISYLSSIISGYTIKAEYSTNDKDINVIVVQETSGNKVVFYGSDNPLYNYFNIEIFGDNIQGEYETANKINDLIGKNIYVDYTPPSMEKEKYYVPEKWQIMFKQYTNPRAIEYYDIRRVSYTSTYQCVVNKIADGYVEQFF